MEGSTDRLRQKLRPRSVHGPRWISLDPLANLLLATTIVLMFLFSLEARAEQLPLRRYTTADGLASNAVYCVKRDSHGFLWFCTGEGLSRFDGYTFVNYGVDQGLPDRVVIDFVETPSGEYWVATHSGLVKFNPKPRGNEVLFVRYPLDETQATQGTNELLVDHHGDVWVAAREGVFQLARAGERWVSKRVSEGSEGPLIEDHAGNIWVVLGGPQSSLWRRRRSGELERISDPFLMKNKIVSLLEDRQGRIWVGTYHGLALLTDNPRPGQPAVARVYSKKDGFLDDVGAAVTFQSSDGRIWAAGGGLYEMLADGDGRHAKFQLVGRSQEGFSGVQAEDAQGNLWMGATRISTHGFVTYGGTDGLTPDDIRSVVEGRDGELYVVTGIHSRFLHRFDGERFTAVKPLNPTDDGSAQWFWGWGQIHFQDRAGEWWIATEQGLLRYPRVARLEDLTRTPPRAIYTTRDGLSGDNIWRLYEDSRGDIWIGAWGGPGLTKWERATRRFHVFTEAEGWKPGLFSSIREDHFGNVWMGLGDGLARFRDGRFTYFTTAQGYPALGVVSMYVDHAGQLWVGTSRSGLVRITDPSADHPQFIVYTTRQGLSSNDVTAITEDQWGRIYFWTGRGVDRLEPKTGAIRHYTEADGLVSSGSDHNVAFTDRQGRLWFGAGGLSRLDPEPDVENAGGPPIRITGVRVRGVSHPVSELGETNLSGLVLDPDQNAVQIDFASLNFGVGQVLQFQYKLEGTDHDWSPPTELRTVNYAKLRPGAYQFQVRTVNSEGVVSSSPALFTFRLMAPVWQRWWFLSLTAALTALAVYGLYQYRLNQLLEVERVRTRIASDLHDDVGSGLTQIAILSEVARHDKSSSDTGEHLKKIADLSRELVEGMSEIVWSMNPQHDQLADLVQRMRRFASDVYVARGIDFDFHAPAQNLDAPLRADVRRQIFLIFKEAVNNAVRHSGCSRASINFSVEQGEIRLQISDNGRGLADNKGDGAGATGHGLKNMRRRATELGGSLEVTSSPNSGTGIALHVPLSRRRFQDIIKTT